MESLVETPTLAAFFTLLVSTLFIFQRGLMEKIVSCGAEADMVNR